MENIETFSAYIYWFFTVLLVILLYGYVYHIYRSEKRGDRDYERYGRLALDDELHDELVEPHERKNKESKKES